jgi:hypothetical protein
MKLVVLIAALSAALAMGASAHAAENLIYNGTFNELQNGYGQIDKYTAIEGWYSSPDSYNYVFNDASVPGTGDFGGITLWDDTMLHTHTTWDGKAPGGVNFVALDGDKATSSPLTQEVIGLVAGQTYDLTFTYAFAQQAGFDGSTDQTLTATMMDGTKTDLSFSTPTELVHSHGFDGWYQANVQFTATSATDLLSFLASSNSGNPPYALLTNISLTAAPEPAVWALMVMGLGGVGLAMRRRRRIAAGAEASATA